MNSGDFIRLQKLQYLHDIAYHSDILALGTQRRMGHIVLHFAKYLSSLKFIENNQPMYKKIFIDAVIMTLSAANMLGILLEDSSSNETNNFIDGYIAIMSSLAKATESADHQENYPIRSSWEKSISEMFSLLVNHAKRIDLDIFSLHFERIAEVEKKSLLLNRFESL